MGLKKICFLIVLALPLLSESQNIQVKVLDAQTNEPLPYATVQIVGMNTGAIGNKEGAFLLKYDDLPKDASVRITYLGYESGVWTLSDLRERNEIRLKPQAIQLQELTISKDVETSVIGSSKKSRWRTGWGDYQSGKGRVKGLLIPVETVEGYYVQSFHFRIDQNDWDSVAFRINLHSVVGDNIGESVLNENIFLVTDQKNQWLEVDMTPYSLFLSQDIIASVEWVDAWGEVGEFSNQMTLSMSKSQGVTYSKDLGQEQGVLETGDLTPSIFLKVR